MAKIVAIPELYTDHIEAAGVTRYIYFWAKFVFDDARIEWHYFGTEAPAQSPDGFLMFQHAARVFPAEFLNLEDADDDLYTIGLRAGMVAATTPFEL